METIRRLVDWWSEIKLNQLQLYTEHTFAYAGHETVWKDASPMTPEEIVHMFGEVPASLFRVHDWRNDITTLGEVPAEFVREVTDGICDFTWPAQVNRLLVEGGYDLILSIGQVVPHEVVGMANYNKNVFVGTGGVEGINKSHYLGAVYGMERIMGETVSPVRLALNEGFDQFVPLLVRDPHRRRLGDGIMLNKLTVLSNGDRIFV